MAGFWTPTKYSLPIQEKLYELFSTKSEKHIPISRQVRSGSNLHFPVSELLFSLPIQEKLYELFSVYRCIQENPG